MLVNFTAVANKQKTVHRDFNIQQILTLFPGTILSTLIILLLSLISVVEY